jgi:prepilin-type N-terminal cleavage/methylation domain-containing protein
MKNRSGFTLVEIMITVAVLSLGTLLIHQGLLRSADALGHYNNLLAAQEWAEDKLWDTRESLLYSSDGATAVPAGGSFTEFGKEFECVITTKPQSNAENFYGIQIQVSWQEGHKPVNYTVSTFATDNKRIGF